MTRFEIDIQRKKPWQKHQDVKHNRMILNGKFTFQLLSFKLTSSFYKGIPQRNN
jgi:hypothetical protein